MITGWRCHVCDRLWACDASTVLGFLKTMLLVPVFGWHTYVTCHVRRHRPCRCSDCIAHYGWPPVLPSHIPPSPPVS